MEEVEDLKGAKEFNLKDKKAYNEYLKFNNLKR